MIAFRFVAVIFPILLAVSGGPAPQNEDLLRFSDRQREPDDSESRTFRRAQNVGGGSNIENIFKIPIAVIKGTAAAAQAFYPQNTEYINKIFDIPVTTLDAVGNYIRDRPQRLGSNIGDDNGQQTPTRFGNQRLNRRRDERDQRRERISQLRERERLESQRRQRRRSTDEEEKAEGRTFFGGPHSIGLDDFAYAFADLLVGGGGHGGGLFGGHGGGLFGGHGHHHGHGQHGIFGKPPKRPLRPTRPPRPSRPHKPHKPGHFGGGHGGGNGGGFLGSHGGGNGGGFLGSHGGGNGGGFLGSHGGGNGGGYEVNEQFDDSPVQSVGSAAFSWLQTTFPSDPKIENKIAPGSGFRSDRDVAEFRAL